MDIDNDNGDDNDDLLPPRKHTKMKTKRCIIENTATSTLEPKHALLLLKIKGLKYIADAKCVITDNENNTFDKEAPGCISITPADFRIDLSQVHSTPFNCEAIQVFSRDFLDKVTRDSWYSKPPIPQRYCNIEVIVDCFHDHLKYIKGRYNHCVVAMNKDPVVAKAGKEKKARLFKWHLEAVAEDSRFTKHRRLLEALGTQGMSSDESEDESRRSSQYPHMYPSWRSRRLSSLLWQLNPVVDKMHSTPIGTHKRPGSQMQVRPHTQNCNIKAAAPVGLPRNCYDAQWLSGLSTKRIVSLKMKDYDYPFGQTAQGGSAVGKMSSTMIQTPQGGFNSTQEFSSTMEGESAPPNTLHIQTPQGGSNSTQEFREAPVAVGQSSAESSRAACSAAQSSSDDVGT
ncbi:hypothetical protein HYDPIDRAFT_170843 [Hydnomerulius pinastri MD-312]|uniref:Uncharacterized protein n=1 Tax=Hydnomerulius pinastri MD-312 TaxID=994086 RepID=A0A0C9V274_9AGAM|nr:hypothetical protein HYDPIDRAFT_170843 [Hydnomerulius pinastri MD-312]